MKYLLLLGIFILSTLLVLIIYSLITYKKPIHRLDKFFKKEKKERKDPKHTKKDFQAAFGNIGKKIVELLALKKIKAKIDKSLEKGDIPFKAEEYIGIMLFIEIMTFCIAYIFTKRLSVAFIMVAIEIIGGRVYPKNKAKKRLITIENQLGDALDMMAGSLRAGQSLFQAMETVSKEMPPPIAKELSKTIKEINIGVTVEEGLMNLLERVPSENLELMVIAVIIQRQIGGNLAEILDSISQTIRGRIKLKREVRVLTAQGRMSGWVISLLPIGFILILFLLNPSYIMLLFTDSLGRIMLLMGVVGQLLGVFFITRLLDIKY